MAQVNRLMEKGSSGASHNIQPNYYSHFFLRLRGSDNECVTRNSISKFSVVSTEFFFHLWSVKHFIMDQLLERTTADSAGLMKNFFFTNLMTSRNILGISSVLIYLFILLIHKLIECEFRYTCDTTKVTYKLYSSDPIFWVFCHDYLTQLYRGRPGTLLPILFHYAP